MGYLSKSGAETPKTAEHTQILPGSGFEPIDRSPDVSGEQPAHLAPSKPLGLPTRRSSFLWELTWSWVCRWGIKVRAKLTEQEEMAI